MRHLKVFTSKTCGPCKALSPMLADLNILVVKVDVQEQAAVAEMHGIRQVPVLKLYDDFTLIGTRYGLQTKQQLEEFIRS